MAYKTGLRVLAALFSLTIIGLPVGVLLWRKARREEQRIEAQRQAMQDLADDS